MWHMGRLEGSICILGVVNSSSGLSQWRATRRRSTHDVSSQVRRARHFKESSITHNIASIIPICHHQQQELLGGLIDCVAQETRFLEGWESKIMQSLMELVRYCSFY